ncbi:MAG: dephospho-CoA kinase [Sedimentisphaerales bacterium]|nr:dephospho-CoA kinase [Sedimentisphaerales bacterium]
MKFPKPVIGITGGIGSGKSTVSREFARLGCAVIDADQINHEVLELPAVKAKLREWWGEGIFTSAGNIDRKALGLIVWADHEAMRRLTALTHPEILQRQGALLKQYQEDTAISGVILDVPLLFEIGWDKYCDAVIFVDAPESLRLERLKKRGFNQKSLKKAENLQFSLDKKAKMSDYTVRNNSGFPELTIQVEKIFSSVRANKPPEK